MKPRSGDPCPANCGGRLKIRTSKRIAEFVQRYLECTECSFECKTRVPVEEVWRRVPGKRVKGGASLAPST